jgi:hypothetical protein
MKRIFFNLLIIMFLVSCSNPEKKSKELIKQYMKEHLNDFGSYEPVKYGTLDSAFTSAMDTEDWGKYDKKYLEFEEKANKETEKMNKLIDNMGFHSLYTYKEDKFTMETLKKNVNQDTDSMRFYNNKMKIMHENFVKEFKGWTLNHTYRAKNALGNKVIGNIVFVFDKEIDKIIDVKNTEM